VLCACQALDLLAPLTTSAPLVRVHAAVRARVPTLVDDRSPAPDLDRIAEMIRTGSFEYASGAVVN
jgi:histidine ammonia-lyase